MDLNLDNKVYFEDAMKLLSRLKTKSIDLAIVDPPYQINATSHRKNHSRTKLAIAKHYKTPLWDQVMPSQRYFNELLRVSRFQIIFGINYFVETRNIPIGSGRIVWDKVNGESSYSDAEIAGINLFKSTRIIPYMWNGMMQGKSFKEGRVMQGDKTKNEVRIHPTQKPVELYKALFHSFAKKGWKILDTHVGSGSIRIAAALSGLPLIGSEMDEGHFNDQEKRWKEFVNLPRIPFPEEPKLPLHLHLKEDGIYFDYQL